MLANQIFITAKVRRPYNDKFYTFNKLLIQKNSEGIQNINLSLYVIIMSRTPFRVNLHSTVV